MASSIKMWRNGMASMARGVSSSGASAAARQHQRVKHQTSEKLASVGK
jgi:hypothetical protein